MDEPGPEGAEIRLPPPPHRHLRAAASALSADRADWRAPDGRRHRREPAQRGSSDAPDARSRGSAIGAGASNAGGAVATTLRAPIRCVSVRADADVRGALQPCVLARRTSSSLQAGRRGGSQPSADGAPGSVAERRPRGVARRSVALGPPVLVAQIRRSLPSQYGSRSRRFCSLPVSVRGKSSTKSIERGCAATRHRVGSPVRRLAPMEVFCASTVTVSGKRESW
jgi:hypothetical protein